MGLTNCGVGSRYQDDGKYAPWNFLCGFEPFEPPVKGAKFDYASREFHCLGDLKHSRGGKLYVWQVTGGAPNLASESIRRVRS